MMNHWIFRCSNISELISRSMDEKLGFKIRLGIKLHLMVCCLCRRYKHQIHFIETALLKLEDENLSDPPVTRLPEDVKKRLKEKIG